MDQLAHLSVARAGSGLDLNLDVHRAGVHCWSECAGLLGIVCVLGVVTRV